MENRFRGGRWALEARRDTTCSLRCIGCHCCGPRFLCWCLSHTHTLTLVQVRVSINDGGSFTAPINYYYYLSPKLIDLYPKLGPDQGGTLLSIQMESAYSIASLSDANLSAACKIGRESDFLIVPATVQSNSLVRCLTPRSQAFTTATTSVSIWLTFNGLDFLPKQCQGQVCVQPLLFSYFVTPVFALLDANESNIDSSLAPMIPSSGSFRGGTVVTFRWPTFPTQIFQVLSTAHLPHI